MLLGTYERAGVPWSARTTPWDFGQDLLPNDLERIAPSLEVGFEHFPAPRRTPASRRSSTGPFTFAPDGNPLVGPVRGLRNFWVACGVMAGFSQGGGVGLALSHWMVDGDPGADIWGMDVARYGDWATLAYTNAKVRENYSRRFRIRFPNEELAAARPLRTTPIYEKLQAEHAVFGDYCGLEHPLWFAPSPAEAHDDFSFRRSNAHPHVAEECRAVQRIGRAAGNFELRKIRDPRPGRPRNGCPGSWPIACPGAGRIALTPMLNERGRLIGDFTICRVAGRAFLPDRHLCRGSATICAGSSGTCPRLASACAPAQWSTWACRWPGPDSRALLQSLVRDDLSTAAFPFMSFRRMDVGMVPGLRRPRILHGRPGLRDLGDKRLPARAVRPAAAGGPRVLARSASAAAH